MKIHHRPFKYESPDFKSMCSLIVRDNAIKKECFVWHIARVVDWKYNLFNIKRRLPGNYATAAHLWVSSNDDLAGFVISEEFDNQFDIIVLDKYNYLYPEMPAGISSEWGKQYSDLTTCADETNVALIGMLEQTGYKRTKEIELTRVFNTSRFSACQYPVASLSFQSMAQNKKYDDQTLLRLSAWPHKEDKETDDAIRAYCRTSPIYDSRFDFVLVDDSGAHLSGCEAFIDRVNKTAEIERVCTHSEHHNKGYAQMTLKSCLRALHESHIPTAYLSGGYEKTIHLYGKLGHEKEIARFYYKLEMTS